MNKIYTFSTKDFQPISFRDVYLYDCYSSVYQFLRSNKFSVVEITRFAKPELRANSSIDWHADFKGVFKPIDSFDDSIKNKVLYEYGQLNDRIDKFCIQLKNMNTSDGQEWYELLSAVFDQKNLLLVSNGSDWALIWGWRFNNLNVNYRVPEFTRVESTPIIEPHIDEKISSVQDLKNEKSDSFLARSEDPPLKTHTSAVAIPARITWWQRIFKFLRWFTYRWWFLLLFLALLPLIFCLVRCVDRWLCAMF